MEKINLHDATVLNVEYDQQNQNLKLYLEISNFLQANYKEGDPEILTGALIFRSVTLSQELRSFIEIVNSKENADIEILRNKVHEVDDSIATEINMCMRNYSKREDLYSNLNIVSKTYEWQIDR